MPGPPFTGGVTFTVLDGQAGVATVPSNTVQAIIGCATSGTDLQVVPTRSTATLQSTFTSGPLMEAAGLVVQAGGTALAVKAPTVTAGTILNSAQAATNISGVSIVVTNARITYTAQTPHVLALGDVVTIASVVGSTEVNGTWRITAIIDATHFEIGVSSITPYVSGGTVQYTGGITGGSSGVGTFSGTANPYITGTPVDDGYVQVVAQTGFTVGTTGGTVICSLDAGRSYGPPIPVGTNTTINLKDVSGYDSGLVLHLGGSGKTWTGGGVNAAGAIVGDFVRCSTVAPQPNDTGISNALGALITYLAGSEGVFPIVQIVGIMGASDATAIQSGGTNNLTTMAAAYLFERGVMSTRDASPPSAWGGTGETEATWETSLISAFSATTAPRVCATAGYYNMPSAFPTQTFNVPRYRRPFSFALCAREVAIDTQRHPGKVGGTQGGALTQIVVDPTRDPGDGFIYHNEATSPAFDYLLGGTGRMATARTVQRKAGFFASNPLTLAAQGSDFTLLPAALVMDVACTLTYNALVNFVFADLTTKSNGTLTDVAASTIYRAVYDAIQSAMVGVGMISTFAVVVDQTQNVQITKTIVVRITILGVVYVMEIDTSIGFTNSLAAQGSAAGATA